MTEEQERLVKELVGTIDSETGLLLERVGEDGKLIYTSVPRSKVPFHDVNGELQVLPLFTTLDHSKIKIAFSLTN